MTQSRLPRPAELQSKRRMIPLWRVDNKTGRRRVHPNAVSPSQDQGSFSDSIKVGRALCAQPGSIINRGSVRSLSCTPFYRSGPRVG
jgi:hypothetical protein